MEPEINIQSVRTSSVSVGVVFFPTPQDEQDFLLHLIRAQESCGISWWIPGTESSRAQKSNASLSAPGILARPAAETALCSMSSIIYIRKAVSRGTLVSLGICPNIQCTVRLYEIPALHVDLLVSRVLAKRATILCSLMYVGHRGMIGVCISLSHHLSYVQWRRSSPVLVLLR